MVGKFKDVFFPQPRLDFYALVQAKKRKDSPHGIDTPRDPPDTQPIIEGKEFKPKIMTNPFDDERELGPYY
jgi:hypothetical protein